MVIQKFQRAGAQEVALDIFRGSLHLSGMSTKRKKNMAAITRSVNRTT